MRSCAKGTVPAAPTFLPLKNFVNTSALGNLNCESRGGSSLLEKYFDKLSGMPTRRGMLLPDSWSNLCRKEVDSPWSWIVCCCATIIVGLFFGMTLNFGILFPVLMNHFQETRERTGKL